MQKQTDAAIKRLNARIGESTTADFACPGWRARGDVLVVQPETIGGQKALTVLVKAKDGQLLPSIDGRTSAPMITVLTPMSTISAAFGVSPSQLGRGFDPARSMEPNACILLKPAGNAEQWHDDMDGICGAFVDAFSKALYANGTCIPKDTVNTAITKKAKTLSPAKFKEWVEELISGPGSPHMAHVAKHLGDEAEDYRFSKKLFSNASADTDTPYDSLIGPPDLISEIRQSLGRSSKYSPVPIYVNSKLVGPDEYEQVSKQLVGSTGYLELWCKCFTNTSNRVVSCKFGVSKLVVSLLAPETSRGDTVVDVSAGDDETTVDVAAAVLEMVGENPPKRARVD